MNDLIWDGSHYIAFVLTEECRKKVLEQVPPIFRNVVCHHITIAYDFEEKDIPAIKKVIEKCSKLPKVYPIRAYTRSVGRGGEYLVVTIWTRTIRPTGGFYHLTMSLDDGVRARDANLRLVGPMDEIKSALQYLRDGKWDTKVSGPYPLEDGHADPERYLITAIRPKPE